MTCLMALWSPAQAYADTLYKQNTGADTTLDTATFTPAAPNPLLQNYAEGTAFTAGDSIVFNNAITGATTFRISGTNTTNLSVAGLTIGSLFNGSLLNPGGTITIRNGAGASGSPVANTLTLGAGGIDLSLSTRDLTISQDTTNGSSLTVTTSAVQTWKNRTGRTISLAAAPFTLGHNLTLEGAGSTTFGGNGTGAISGAGNLIINGSQSGGTTGVALSGTNTGWTGSVQVGSTSHLRTGVTLTLDQLAAGQNKIADASTLAINHAKVNLQGTGGGTETVAGVSLGQGLNAVTRSAGTGILQMNGITRATGAAVDFGNIATSGTSHVTTDVLNTAAGQIGAWAVGINGTTDANWIKTAGAGSDISALALSGTDYTTQNNLNSWAANQNIIVNGATTASTASRTIGSLKMTTAAITALDIGAGNTLTINDGANGGGILGVGNFARTIGAATVGQGTLTAGAASDGNADTLYFYNLQNTTTVNMTIADNGTDALHLFSGGAGTVTVRADNSYTGGTTIAAGTLAIGDNTAAADNADLGSGDIVNHGTLVLSKTTGATAAQMTIANNITGTGAFTINRGIATLSGNNDYSGATNVSTATTLRAGSATGISANSRMLLNAATAVLDLNGFDVSVAALRGDQTTANVNLGTNTLTLSGSELANTSTAEILPFVSQVYQGGFSATAGNLIKNGLYTQIFTAGGTIGYTGTTVVNNGILQTNKAMSTSGVTVNNGSQLTAFISNVANSLSATASMNLAASGAIWQVNNGFSQSIGSLAGVANSRLNVARGATATNITVTDNGGTPATFAGVIQEAGTGTNGASFTKDGTNTLILTGGNNYSGATTVNGGILQIGTANSVQVIPDRSAVSIGATGTLDLNNNNETIGSLAGAAGGLVTLGTGTLTTGLDNSSTDFSGVISGTGGLVKIGTGTQTLSGANTFTGPVILSNLGGQTGGGLTLGAGGSLADTAAVVNRGYNTVFTVNNTDTMGPVTGSNNTAIALGTGATLTSTYTDGTPTALAGTADSAAANGRIVRDIDTSLLKVGDLISGTGITAPGYVVQVLDANTVLVNRTPPAGPSLNFAPTVTSVSVLGSALTGAGGFTKDGTGLLILTGNSTHTGATTIKSGTVQIGGIWTGQKFALNDILSNSSQIVFASTGTQKLSIADSTNNLLSFERVGSVAGGAGATSTIQLEAGSHMAVLALGSDNSTSTFTGQIMGPGGSATMLIKEGTGNFTWSNPTSNVFDGPVVIDRGTFTIAGAQGFDGSNEVYISNGGANLTVTTTGGDSIPFLQGGKGATRYVIGTSSAPIGGTPSNYIATTTPIITLTTNLTVSEGTSPNLFSLAGVYTFNGDIQGAGTLVKSGNHLWNLTGTSSNAHTGETQITAGTLQMGILSGAAGLGAAGAGTFGTLSTATGLRLTGGTLAINGTSQTVTRINASSTGGTIALGNGSLTLSNQNTQSTATLLTGNRNGVLNINSSAASTLTFTGSSWSFAGTINVGTNAAIANGTGGNIGDASRINLNGTGTQLTLAISDTIGSLAGTGSVVLNSSSSLYLSQAASGTVSSTGFSGATSGTGGIGISNFGGFTVSGNLAHTGSTTLEDGSSLNLNYGSGNNILSSGSALALSGGNVRIFSSAATATILESVASTSLNAGASSVQTFINFTADTALTQGPGNAGINLAAITRAAGGTLNVAPNAAATSTANVNGILGDANTAYATFDSTTWAVANGASTAISGLATFNADTFTVNQHTDITVAGANVGGNAATIRFSGANATDITGATNLDMGGILVRSSVGANTSTISGALSATGNELIIHQYNPFGDLLLSNVAGTNTAITTAGGGRTLITNDIAGTGTTTIGYGYLQLGNGGTAGMVGSGTILNNGTLGINRSNAQTISAVISGTGNIEQLGTGTTTLSGTNTFAGRVTVRGGTLEVTNNAALGLAVESAATPTNRWGNLNSVNTGGTLRVNVAAGGTITELLNLDGGTLDLRSAVATTLAGPIVLTSDSTIHVSNSGTAVNHVITGDIIALPGADLTVTNVGGATPSTLILTPTGTSGARWENTTINAGGRLQIGGTGVVGSRGFLGTGNIVNNGTLIVNPNDGYYVINNTITGAGTLDFSRGTNGLTYLTGDLSGFTGTLRVSSLLTNTNSDVELGNDTYGTSYGSGAINIVASNLSGGGGRAQVRTHFIQDIVLNNSITLSPGTDGTNAKYAYFTRAGIGSVTLTGTLTIGATNAAPGTQRAILQTDAGGILNFEGTLVGDATHLLNIVNNGIFRFGGSASNTYHGVLSGNNVWIFDNTGTTTLMGVNTFNTGSTYLQKGTVVIGTGGVDTIHNDNDVHVLNGAILSVAGNETIGQLYMQRGAITTIASGVTLTVDDSGAQLIAGSIQGAGNLTLAGGNYMAMYGTNTATGTLNLSNGSLQLKSLANAIGSFSTVNLGATTTAGNLEYVGSGETYAGNFNLTGTTGGARITANGNGALILTGNITNTVAGDKTLTLSGQTGGYFNPIRNRVDGIISEGANKLHLSMPNTANDDRFGITGRWALTNASNDFSGNITVNVGMLEFMGDLKTGVETTSAMGDLSATRTITLGSDNFDGRRYDFWGSSDRIGAAGFSQGTNTLTPSGDVGTIIFNDSNAGTATFGSNISWAIVTAATGNTTGGQIINDGTKTIVINGNLTSGSTGTHYWILDGTNTTTNTIGGIISNPTTSQTTGVYKEGAGTWRLSGANTYTGTTTINNGILELAGGLAIHDSGGINIAGDGGDGLYSGVAKLRVVNSETIATLTGDVLTEAEILAGQTLTIAGGNSTMNGLITGGGNLTRTVSGATAGTLSTSASNTYTGITTLGATGSATANAGIAIWQLANGGAASGLGTSSNAAANLVFVTDTAGDNGGVLTWSGLTDQSTDRLFTMGLGVAGARINASGTVIGTNAPTMTWSNTGAIAFTGSGTRTLTLGGGTANMNVFRPAITDGGGATSLIKADGGYWLIDPAAAANTFTGGTTITGGTLAIQAGNALGTNTITINGASGVGLELRGGITVANNVTTVTTAEGGFGSFSGNNVLTGTVTLSNTNARVVTAAGSSLTLSNATAAWAGTGSLTKHGNGTLILSGVNTSTGGLLVRNGIVELNYATNNTSKLADGAALTLGGVVANNVAGLDANVEGQTLQHAGGGGTIHLNGGSHTEVVASTTLDAGSSAVTRAGGSTAILRMNAITRNSSGGTIDFGAAGIADTDTLNTNGIIGVGYATVAKTDWAINSTGAVDGPITALATYSVDTYGATNNVDVTTYAGVGTAANTLRFNNAAGGTLTLGGTFAMTGGGLLVTPNVAGGNVVITGGAIQNAANTAGLEALIVHQHSTTNVLEINSVIQNNTNAQALTKTGAGKLILSGLNTFTGNVNLFEGEIQVGGTAAAPTTATNAYLSGLGSSGNMSTSWVLAEDTTLRFLTTNTSTYNTPTLVGAGKIIMDTGNQGVLLFDDNSDNWSGDIDFKGGTIRVGLNNAALGGVRGLINVDGNVNFIFQDVRSINKLTNYAQGTVFNIQNHHTDTAAGTFSGTQNFNNTTTAGLEFNVAAPTTAGTVSLNISGIINATNGFTKTGNGILQISANNFADVYDGYTGGISKTPTLSGQIAVNGGVLYVGGTRALGALGVGNEVIVASGASLDLRGYGLNYGDDPTTTRKIVEISGMGFGGTGALRNSSGTGQLSHLTLNADSLINSGGTANGSAFIIGTFDTNLSNANSLSGAFTRNAPVINGGGFNLTIQGGRIATSNFVIADPTFTSALGSLIIREGGSIFRHEIIANIGGASGVGITAANITGGVEIGYGGVSAADLTGAFAGTGANVGARLLFENWYGTHHSVPITMNGVIAATAPGNPGGARSLVGGHNFLQVDFFTIPDGVTYLDGGITLMGDAMRNIITSDSYGNYSIVEQGNTTVGTTAKLVLGGALSGTGGFTKMGMAEVRLTAANTFTGDVNVLRYGASSSPMQSNTAKIYGVDYATNGTAEAWAEWSLTLNGANGAITSAGNINLQRRGMITLDNTNRLDATSGVVGANNNDRIGNTTVINMNNGWLRLNGGTVTNTEAFGTINVQSGTNIFDLYGQDGSGADLDITIGTLNRSAGSALRFVNLDATSTFATALTGGEDARVAVTTLGATQIGAGGAANTTNRSIVQGIFGGNAPLGLDTDFRILGFNNGNVTDLYNQQRNLQYLSGSHFMTYDGGFLRPLDDDEYFTPADGILSSATPAGQNVNLSDVLTQVKNNTTINSLRFGALTDHDGTGATGIINHHAIILNVDGTLKISSGMISSAYWTTGSTSSSTTQILGGVLDFDGKEAIINNQNAYYATTSGSIGGGGFEIRSIISNAAGLTKTGFQTLYLDGANTYTGITTINEGYLFLRHGRSAAGAGGAGNGIVITGVGGLFTGNGVVVGTPTAREDIYVGVLAGDQYVMRNDNDVTVWNSNLTIDNVDAAGMTLYTAYVRTDNSSTSIINGSIAGGDTPISNDVTQIDSRVMYVSSTGNNVIILRGQVGDRFVGGNAVPIADPISALPTVAGVRTNENEVLRVSLYGGSDETNLILDRQYNAAGRLTIVRGTLILNYDPAGVGLDGTGFWTDTALSKIPGADSTYNFALNGGTGHQGFILGSGDNLYGAVFLSRANQIFNMATWQTSGTGAKFIGGLNQSGTVTYGNGTGTLQHGDNGSTTGTGAVGNLYAMDGGTVIFKQRMIGNIGTIANQVFGILKQGRGTVELQASSAGSATSAPVLAGGTLILNHSGASPTALVGNTNIRFDGGSLISLASSAANTTASLATSNAANRLLQFSTGGNEIVARTTNLGTARNMTLNLGNTNANNNTSNFTRSTGATANLVEDNSAGGTASITLQFNSFTTAALKNQIIAWATYGILSRTALDFAMSDGGASSDVKAYSRALDEYNNNVATWAANQDVSENGGAGFSGTLGAALTLSTLRFDANADSTIDLGANTLTLSGNGLASSGGAILVSSNTGSANKTITGTGAAALTTTGGTTELIIHHYGYGNLNLNVPITGTNVDLVITGPSTTNAATIGTTGAVVLGATNTFTGQLFLNGSVLSFDKTAQLGANSGGTAIVMNGGTLRYTGTGMTSLGNKGILFNGNGGTIDVANGGAELLVGNGSAGGGDISSADLYRGDLIKVGAGTLTLQGGTDNANASFKGLIDIRQGTLRLNGDIVTTSTSGITSTVLGTSNSFVDGTIFRTGTNLAVQFGNRNDSSDWYLDEWMTFEGNNYVSIGTINTGTGNTSDTPGGTELSIPVVNPNFERPINFGGVITLNGTTTFDVVSGQTFRIGYNGSGAGYLTGSGTLIKDGLGTMEIRTNNPDYTGNIQILQGRLYSFGQADPLGTGYLSGATITLGSTDRQGIAELAPNSENALHGWTVEVNHDINVVYNPAQTKRLLFETFGNAGTVEVNGDITLNDNLVVYINDGAEVGGSQNYINFNGVLKDGATTSGNLIIAADDAGSANDNTGGRPYQYLVLKGDNSLFTGDVRINHNTGYDQDQTAILRLENNNALTAANDVDMGYNSMLQVGGGSRTIGALTTSGGTGPFIGGNAGGTMGASTNGSTEIIENAASTAGTLTITQNTPATTEVQWDAHFRDGTLNSQFFAPGAGPTPSASLSVVKAGSGWATLTLDNDYTGSTTVTGGILQVGRGGVGDTGNATTNGGFTANAGTTVAGTGQIHGSSTILGNLNPGDEAGGSMGTLVFTGATTFGSTSIINLQTQRASYTMMNAVGYDDTANYNTWRTNIATDTTYSHLLNDPVTTAQHDKVIVNASLLTMVSGSKITVINNGYNPTAGDVFNLLDWTGAALSYNVGGTASNGGLIRTGAETGTDLDLFELGSNYRWDVSLFNSQGIIVVVVPEPSRMFLLLFGILGIFYRRRR